jgi:hypothetical protein
MSKNSALQLAKSLLSLLSSSSTPLERIFDVATHKVVRKSSEQSLDTRSREFRIDTQLGVSVLEHLTPRLRQGLDRLLERLVFWCRLGD